ncbi:sensor histidine kinase [Alkalibacterium thalassium]|uniref:histidine kinase n=1 Tax=Alkalibacterium thalassium TaxID=426701 RepID=A0A1G9AEM2_9LACT|nr:histidine kinase [Alkalibacterium thalassium]SDK25274.1 Signal transduction histidine kinase [Alkalibacterium thalassium]
MISFWTTTGFLLGLWLAAVFQADGVNEWKVALSIPFFLIYFLLPILNKKVRIAAFLILPVLVLLPLWGMGSSPLIWFIFSVLGIEYGLRSELGKPAVYLTYLLLVSLSPNVAAGISLNLITHIASMSFLLYLVYMYEQTVGRFSDLRAENERLYSDYRYLKRRVSRAEQLARQEERSAVARDIHDSVGHRLTALVMQLEVARYQSSNEAISNQLAQFKELANASLQETREAVSALKADETAGLQAVIQLVRKLEAESHLQVRFLFDSGVLNVPLSNAQSVVIYRAIQESLTNMMRHSGTRQADIQFKLIAGRYFQFTVSHKLMEKVSFSAGFGLTNMRKRLEEIEGDLDIKQSNHLFVVRGRFPFLSEEGEGSEND